MSSLSRVTFGTASNDGSLFKSLRAAGYRVDNITTWQYDNSSETHFYSIRRPYMGYREYTRFAAWELADLSLFRHAPHVLREGIYNDQKWRLQQVFGPRDTSTRRYHSGNGAAVLDEFARRLTPAVDGPLYKFVHVGIPHLPVVLNANCEFIGAVRSPDRVAYRGQARCAVTKVTAILDRLKELGLYDSSLIVISSDHGIGHTSPRFTHDQHVPSGALSRLAGKALALLIVKPPNSRGPVRISYAPSTISDVPATVMDILGLRHNLPGEPALRLAENASRTRTFAMYDWEGWTTPFFDALDVMEINGRVLDGDSWRLKASFYAPDKGEEARARGLYQRQRNARGVVYQWGSPHVFLHAPSTARSFEVTRQVDRRQSADGDRFGRRSRDRSTHTQRSPVGHAQTDLTGGFRQVESLDCPHRQSIVEAARVPRAWSDGPRSQVDEVRSISERLAQRDRLAGRAVAAPLRRGEVWR